MFILYGHYATLHWPPLFGFTVWLLLTCLGMIDHTCYMEEVYHLYEVSVRARVNLPFFQELQDTAHTRTSVSHL